MTASKGFVTSYGLEIGVASASRDKATARSRSSPAILYRVAG
ncbi:MAG: hypothetical protein ACR2N1_13180 [Rubripirellula sp.]